MLSLTQPKFLSTQHSALSTQHYSLIQTFFGSVKKRSASNPPSRPTPEFFTPPKGVRKSRSSHVFTQTIPASSLWARRWHRLRSELHSEADNPYSVEFACLMASSSESKGIRVATGPKISS